MTCDPDATTLPPVSHCNAVSNNEDYWLRYDKRSRTLCTKAIKWSAGRIFQATVSFKGLGSKGAVYFASDADDYILSFPSYDERHLTFNASHPSITCRDRKNN